VRSMDQRARHVYSQRHTERRTMSRTRGSSTMGVQSSSGRTMGIQNSSSGTCQ
jgi:hypothetical protein